LERRFIGGASSDRRSLRHAGLTQRVRAHSLVALAHAARQFSFVLQRGVFNFENWRRKMGTPELERQSQALIAFEKSIGRPIKAVQWQYAATMKEPMEHRAWRLYAATLERFRLYADADLELSPEMKKLFCDVENSERAAWAAWCKTKHALEMDLLTGRRKSLPWSC
jgi:hypothetical protein